jgi:hypothetical protein
MRLTFAILVAAALLVVPMVSADAARTVTKDYTYVPAPPASGCGALAVYEHCFPVRAGESSVRVDIADDVSPLVPFRLLASIPAQDNVDLGTWCGSTDEAFLWLPGGTTGVRVNFALTAVADCGFVGTTGTITVGFA